MNFYQIISLALSLVGFPTLFSIFITYRNKNRSERKKDRERAEATEMGIKALLRAEMIKDYNKWHEDRGYAPIWVKDNFENEWKQYESLVGENGVMEDIHDKFMALPTISPKKK